MFLAAGSHRRHITVLFGCILAAGLLQPPTHAGGDSSVRQYAWIEIDRREVRVGDTLIAGASGAARLWADIDRNGDGIASASEARTWTCSAARGLLTLIDGRPLAARLDRFEVPDRGKVVRGQHPIGILMRAALPVLEPGGHLLRVENHLLAGEPCLLPALALRALGIAATDPVTSREGRVVEIAFQ